MTERQTGTAGWWLWAVGGAVVSIGALALLEPWFRVVAGGVVGWAVFAGMSFPDRRRIELRKPTLWWVSASMVVLLVGLSLLLGAVGLSNDNVRTDSVVPGAVLGGVLFVLGGAGLLVARSRQRRRAVDAEVERFRDEQSAATTADDRA
jgi:hypothetical protein